MTRSNAELAAPATSLLIAAMVSCLAPLAPGRAGGGGYFLILICGEAAGEAFSSEKTLVLPPRSTAWMRK